LENEGKTISRHWPWPVSIHSQRKRSDIWKGKHQWGNETYLLWSKAQAQRPFSRYFTLLFTAPCHLKDFLWS